MTGNERASVTASVRGDRYLGKPLMPDQLLEALSLGALYPTARARIRSAHASL